TAAVQQGLGAGVPPPLSMDRYGWCPMTATVSDITDIGVRRKLQFASGDSYCAAWHYPGTNGACVVMAGGFAVTKEPGTDRFARRFAEAGFSVLAFDHRHL